MKYAVIIFVFLVGLIVGRWSKSVDPSVVRAAEKVEQAEEAKSSDGGEIFSKAAAESKELGPQKFLEESTDEGSEFKRTESSQVNKQMLKLQMGLRRAIDAGQTEKQNRIFSQMQKLSPRHEKVYEAKVQFLEDDQKWEEATEVLKDCISTLPDSVYCHQRITNIRTSTLEEKIQYGESCLRINADDPMCSVDLAIAYRLQSNFQRSRELLEATLRAPDRGIGFFKNYVLYQYGLTLEKLGLLDSAHRAFSEACELESRDACDRMKRNG